MGSMNRWMPGLWLVAAQLALGCGGGGGDTNAPILIEIAPVEGSTDQWNVGIHFVANSSDNCREMPVTAVAEVNGQPLEFFSHGGRHWQSVGLFDNRPMCDAIVLSGEISPSSDGVDRIRIRDGAEDVLSVEVAKLLGERSVRWVEPADGVLRAGARAVLEWSPASDQVTFPSGDSRSPLRFEVAQGPEVFPTWSGPFTWDGPQFSFTVASWQADSNVPSEGWMAVQPLSVIPLIQSVSGQYAHAQVLIDGAFVWNPGIAYRYAP